MAAPVFTSVSACSQAGQKLVTTGATLDVSQGNAGLEAWIESLLASQKTCFAPR